MAINAIADSVRNSMCDAFVDAIDGGGGSGLWEVHSAAFAAELATMTFSYPAFGAAAAGVATASAITDDTNATAGTAAVMRVTTSTPTTLYQGTVGTSGADLNLNTLSIAGGDTVSITSATITMPNS